MRFNPPAAAPGRNGEGAVSGSPVRAETKRTLSLPQETQEILYSSPLESSFTRSPLTGWRVVTDADGAYDGLVTDW